MTVAGRRAQFHIDGIFHGFAAIAPLDLAGSHQLIITAVAMGSTAAAGMNAAVDLAQHLRYARPRAEQRYGDDKQEGGGPGTHPTRHFSERAPV